MVYIYDCLETLLLYFQEKHGDSSPKYYGLNKFKPVTQAEVQAIISQGDALYPSVNLIYYPQGQNLKLSSTNYFNQTYICTDKITPNLKSLIKEFSWIEELSVNRSLLHRGLNSIKDIVSEDAHLYLWKLWHKKPRKANAESFDIQVQVIMSKTILTLDQVHYLYGSLDDNHNFFSHLAKNIGTKIGTEIIINYQESDLWKLFIGSKNKLPLLIYAVKNKAKKELIFSTFAIIEIVVRQKKHSLKSALIIWHTWLINSLNECDLDINSTKTILLPIKYYIKLEEILS